MHPAIEPQQRFQGFSDHRWGHRLISLAKPNGSFDPEAVV
jgi:hypothetical protein